MVTLIIILCCVSGMLNASEDLIKDKHEKSIFSSFKSTFFAKDSWLNKYNNRVYCQGRVKWNILGFKFNKPVQLTDWWHFSKMLSLTCYFVSIGLALYSTQYYSLTMSMFWGLIAGCLRNVTFSLFYNHLFIKS